jgi:hypothetical protein
MKKEEWRMRAIANLMIDRILEEMEKKRNKT